ncbi:MAG: DUF2079 domain-containing protein [Clostridia bacterium]|nr:DUF2079 domain-containing protein [Clostridia bacterium]
MDIAGIIKKLKLLNRLKSNTAEKIAVRFFCSVFITSFIYLLVMLPVPFDSYVFFARLPLLPVILTALGVFILLCVVFTFVDSLAIERLILLISYISYAIATTITTASVWFSFGACLVALLICVYVFKDGSAPVLKHDIPKKLLIAAAALCGVYFVAFAGVMSVCRYLTQYTPNYDFGIFSQMFYYMKHTLLPLVTCERDMLTSHFSVHISPIFYLFLPFYAVFPSPATLLVCQAVTLASGVVPVVLICKKLGLSNKAAAAFAFVYALYPALCGGCFYDLHENKFLAPLLLWLFFFVVKKSWPGTMAFSVLVLLVKEDAAAYVAFAGIFVLLCGIRKEKFKGLAMLVLSLAYFGAAVLVLRTVGEGTMEERFSNFMTGPGDGIAAVIANVIKDPAFVVHEMLDNAADTIAETKPEFIIRMMIPLGFLPFVTKKLPRYTLLLPLVLINLMPDYVYQHSIFFQYTYGPLAFLIFAAILNYADLSERTKRTFAVFSAVSAVLICSQSVWQRTNYLDEYIKNRGQHDAVRQAIQSIPEDASVGSTTFYCVTASERRELYELRYTEHEDELDYVILDLRTAEGNSFLSKYECSREFDEYYRLDNWIVIYRRK